MLRMLLAQTPAGGAPAPPAAIPLAVGVVGLIGVIAGAAIVAITTARRERTARRETAQRSALYDLQDAALALRLALQRYDAQAPTHGATLAVDDATGRLAVVRVRVLADGPRLAESAWRPVAELFFAGDPTITVEQEDAAWKAIQQKVGEALRSLG